MADEFSLKTVAYPKKKKERKQIQFYFKRLNLFAEMGHIHTYVT